MGLIWNHMPRTAKTTGVLDNWQSLPCQRTGQTDPDRERRPESSHRRRAGQKCFAAARIDPVIRLLRNNPAPPHPLLQSVTFGKRLQERFFDYHEDLSPQAAAAILGGGVTMYENRNDEWIALIGIEKPEDAQLRGKI